MPDRSVEESEKPFSVRSVKRFGLAMLMLQEMLGTGGTERSHCLWPSPSLRNRPQVQLAAAT